MVFCKRSENGDEHALLIKHPDDIYYYCLDGDDWSSD